MDESIFRARLAALCEEMLALGEDRQFHFDELELIVPLKAAELTTDPHISRLIMHFCENMAVQGRHYTGGMGEPRIYASHKIDSLVSRLCKCDRTPEAWQGGAS